MHCKFQRLVPGRCLDFIGQDLIISTNIENGPIENSKVIDDIPMIDRIYRLYYTGVTQIITVRLQLYTLLNIQISDTTAQINSDSPLDAIGRYYEFTPGSWARKLKLTLYGITTNDNELIASLFLLRIGEFQDWHWENYGSVVRPLTFGDTIKAGFSEAWSITLRFPQTEMETEALTPGTSVRIAMGSYPYLYWSFVIVDGGSVMPTGTPDFVKHVYSIQEDIVSLRETYIPSIFYTAGKYTLAEFLERIFSLSDVDREILISHTDAWSTMLNNWLSPGYQVSSNVLLDNLEKIGTMLGVRLKSRIDTYYRRVIFAYNLRGDMEITTINGRLNGTQKQFKGSSYASRVVANVSEMWNHRTSWWPSTSLKDGIFTAPAEDDAALLTEDGSALVLPFLIVTCDKVKVAGFGALYPVAFGEVTWYDRNMNLIPPFSSELPDYAYSNSLENLTGAGSLYNVVTKEEWMLLDPDGSFGATVHQGNTLYFISGENKIYNVKICDGTPIVADTDPSYYGDSGSGVVPVKQTVLASAKNRYIIHGSFAISADVKFENKIAGSRTAAYIQIENNPAAPALFSNAQEHCDSMANAEESLSYEFDDIHDVPRPGMKFCGKVISDINMTIGYDKIKVQVNLSDELVPKSEYGASGQGEEAAALFADTFTRFSNYRTLVSLSRNLSDAAAIIISRGLDNHLNQNYYALFFTALFPDISYQLDLLEIRLEVGGVGEEIHTALQPAVMAANNHLLISFHTLSHYLAGYTRKHEGSGPFEYTFYPISFSNGSKSRAIRCRGGLTKNAEGSANYPAITANAMNASDWVFQIDDNDYYHDPREKIDMTLQVQFDCLGVSEAFDQRLLDNSCFFNDLLATHPAPYIRIGSIDYAIVETATWPVQTGVLRILLRVDDSSAALSVQSNVMASVFDVDDGLMLTLAVDIVTYAPGQRAARFYAAFTK